jgi:CyaY protein
MTKDTNAEAFRRTLEQLEEILDECDADIDYDTVSDILTIEFEDDSKIIINYQSANGQLWLAARSGGFDLRPTTYDLRPTTYDLRPTTYDLRPTTYDLRPTTYDLKRLSTPIPLPESQSCQVFHTSDNQ